MKAAICTTACSQSAAFMWQALAMRWKSSSARGLASSLMSRLLRARKLRLTERSGTKPAR